jgi:hypothetical protein
MSDTFTVADLCPQGKDSNWKHVPDWQTVVVTSDGGETYIDLACQNCGRSGCVGTARTLTENICW